MQSSHGIGSVSHGTIKTIQPSLSRTSRPFRKRRRNSTVNSLRCQKFRLAIKIIVLGTCIAFVIGYIIVHIVILPFASWIQQQPRETTPVDNMERVPGKYHPNRLFELPNNVENIELWVAPTNIKMMRKDDTLIEQELRQHMEQQCLPSENTKCRRTMEQQKSTTETAITERIGILRPPGQLGHIIEDYVTKYLQKSYSSNDHHQTITIIPQPILDTSVPTPDNQNDWTNYTKIVRPIVMPILLEVLDLILQTTTDNNKSDDGDQHSLVDSITVPDVMATLRILIQYHCYIGQLASASSLHVPVLTISLHHFLTYPQEINDSLIGFFHLEHQHSKFDRTELMESYATTVFQLYDTCTTLLQQIVAKYENDNAQSTAEVAVSFDDFIKSAIQEELHHDYCIGDLQTSNSVIGRQQSPTINRFQFDDTLTSEDGRIVTRMTQSRTTYMIRTMLVENSLITVCNRYPKAPICSSE